MAVGTQNGLSRSENARILAGMVRDEDLEELQSLYNELMSRIGKAHDDGRLFMAGQYVRLVALIGPEIKRIQARFQRETLAAHRKEHKALKLAAKNGAQDA